MPTYSAIMQVLEQASFGAESQEVSILEILNLLAVAGVEGAKDHADAERNARSVRTAVRAKIGDLVTHAERLASAPNRRARKALQASGRCHASRLVSSAGVVDGPGPEAAVRRCELTNGHAAWGLNGSKEHAAKVGDTWARW